MLFSELFSDQFQPAIEDANDDCFCPACGRITWFNVTEILTRPFGEQVVTVERTITTAYFGEPIHRFVKHDVPAPRYIVYVECRCGCHYYWTYVEDV